MPTMIMPSHRSLIAVVLLAWLSACGSGPAPDSGSEPQRFSIRVASEGCFGDCSVFDVEVDETGRVAYWGTRCVARFGAFETRIAAEEARALYRDLRAADLWSWLRNAEQDCDVADDWSQTWTLDVDGEVDVARVQAGCADGERMRQLQAQVLEATGALPWVGEGEPEFNCGYHQPDRLPTGELQLRDGGGSLGILRVMDAQNWELTSCQGERLASGMITIGGHEAILLPAEAELITWPGTEGAHSVELPLDELDGATARVDALDGDEEQTLQSGSECSP